MGDRTRAMIVTVAAVATLAACGVDVPSADAPSRSTSSSLDSSTSRSSSSESASTASTATTIADEPPTSQVTPSTPGPKVVGDFQEATLPPIPPSWLTLDDPSGVSLRYPPEWTAQPSAASPLYLMIDDASAEFRRNVNVTSQPFSGRTLDDYVELSNRQFDDAGSTIEEEYRTTLDGHEAHEWVYRLPMAGMSLRFLGVVAVVDGVAWLVTYTSTPERFDRELEHVEQVLTTVELPDG